ncbi:MAG: hypothetical protein A2986_01430 [Candidatus Jacksonbacteria bacterium RIFCSPLOWO2_01_FULL_44_13]|nr:MAG: hypothetical protein A3B94_02605 [Candidatus Jacksonbacteria bacterium RIFCSPHIGHO2_02_FULL_43_10]OGY70947.1 MAG: hypothetical protein A2986_01430 [Candidatus Jacksonbacteria bacterium RIFCSPLOWO2_01_FULL_44_13]
MFQPFWYTLKKTIIALAPMAGVTDKAFRRICKEQGADVIYTEFASVDALLHGNDQTREMISCTDFERPVVVQLFGNEPKKFVRACKIVESMGFDGIDINFGCPAYKVIKNGGGVACMRNPALVREIVQAACEAVDIPISIKIRASINARITEQERLMDKSSAFQSAPLLDKEGVGGGNITALDIVKSIQDLPVAAVMIHARSYEQAFDGVPDLEMVKAIRPYVKGVLLANGGIHTPEDAKRTLDETGADGVGIARGAWGSPWMFRLIKDYMATGKYSMPDWDQKKEIILRHARLALETKGDHGLIEMRKHLSHYMRGFSHASDMRQQLVSATSYKEIEDILYNRLFVNDR